MFPGARSCLNPCLVCCVSRPDQPLSSYHIDALASRLSPHTRTSAVAIRRQLVPIVGLAHDGVEFLEGFLLGIKKLAIDVMKEAGREQPREPPDNYGQSRQVYSGEIRIMIKPWSSRYEIVIKKFWVTRYAIAARTMEIRRVRVERNLHCTGTSPKEIPQR